MQLTEMTKLTPLKGIHCLFLQGHNEGKVVTDGVERTIADSHESLISVQS